MKLCWRFLRLSNFHWWRMKHYLIEAATSNLIFCLSCNTRQLSLDERSFSLDNSITNAPCITQHFQGLQRRCRLELKHGTSGNSSEMIIQTRHNVSSETLICNVKSSQMTNGDNIAVNLLQLYVHWGVIHGTDDETVGPFHKCCLGVSACLYKLVKCSRSIG